MHHLSADEIRIYDDPVFSVKITLTNGEKIFCESEPIQTNDNQTGTGVIDSFVECLVKKAPPAISGEEVLKAMRAVFASIESSETGRTVAVKQG